MLSLNPKRMKNVYFDPKGVPKGVPQIFTNEGLIFATCQCITISMLLCLKSELQVNERDLFDCFGGNSE